MNRFQIELTPGELLVLRKMVLGPLMARQGDGSLPDDEDDNLTSLNTKLLAEARKHSP